MQRDRHHLRAWVRRAAIVLSGVALISAGCSKSSQPAVTVNGPVGFNVNAASLHDFPIIKANAAGDCGTDKSAYAAELLSTPPQDAKVNLEWGPVVPGKQMQAVGTVSNAVLGHGGDFPLTHPFGDDFTTNIQLDKPFAALAQTLGTQANDIPAGALHSELPEGLFPHDASGMMPDFIPKDGDRIATSGDWIIDCGHQDYHTEIHNMNFMAFGNSSGGKTTVHAFANPYTVSQLFTEDPSLVTDFANQKRFTDPSVHTIGPYLYNLLVDLALGKSNLTRLEAHVLIAPTDFRSAAWYVCAPSGSGSLSYSYKFTVRPGVSITATPDEGAGCVKFTATASSRYTAVVPQRQDCVTPWSVLTKQAEESYGAKLDVQKAIESQVPAANQKTLFPIVKRDPVFDCYTAPAVSPPGGPSGQKVFVDATQPFPFYGEVSVSRS